MTDDFVARIKPDAAEAASDDELMRLLAELWADVDLRGILHGGQTFVQDRLRFYAARGYLTAQERQGILRLFYAQAVPIHHKINGAY